MVFLFNILAFVVAQPVNLSEGAAVAIPCTSSVDYALLTQCVRGPKFHCDSAWWSSNEDLRVYKCVGVPPICMQFDRDGDGDVDLADFAHVTVSGSRESG